VAGDRRSLPRPAGSPSMTSPVVRRSRFQATRSGFLPHLCVVHRPCPEDSDPGEVWGRSQHQDRLLRREVADPSHLPTSTRQAKLYGSLIVAAAPLNYRTATGVYKGRPPSIEPSRVRELKGQGMRPVDIAKALKIGRASVYIGCWQQIKLWHRVLWKADIQTTKSRHPEKNGPDLAGGIGVEAGTCSLGKSGARISNSVCIVAGEVLVCLHPQSRRGGGHSVELLAGTMRHI
jgi:hypothetical protein